MSDGKVVTKISDIPNVEHWAVMEHTTVTIPGDQRSRDYPGHGYPESTEYYMTYRAFTDKAQLEAWLHYNQGSRWGQPIYRVVHITPVDVETKISVKVKP